MLFVESNFPRGGIAKSTPTQEKQNIEFGATVSKHKKDKPNKKQRDERRKLENAEKNETLETVSAEEINIRSLTEGMILMGAVTDVQATSLIVTLPGRAHGRLLITNVSASYRTVINKFVNDVSSNESYKGLEELFKIGQIICVKIMSISMMKEHNRYQINLSMCPEDIQHDFQHQNIRQGMIMCAAIEAIEDYGYVLETGVKNLRGFMSANELTGASIGHVIWCKVDQIKIAASASTAIFKFVELDQRKLKPFNDMNILYLLPTTIVHFKVRKILKDGIQGTIMNNTFTAYANEHQLRAPLAKPTDYEIDQVYEARVLYIMAITKLVYVSLNLDKLKIDKSDSKIKIGDIIETARVDHIGTGGVIVQLNSSAKGLITIKSLRSGYFGNFDADELMAKYHKNSVHRTRVLSYDNMDNLFICSVNEKVLNEKYFSIRDVQIGDYVDAKVNKKLNNGDYYLQVGSIKGYIESKHLAATTPAIKLTKNAKLRCRIIRINEKYNKIFLTNRKELMSKTASLLKSIDRAVIGLEYHGMVVKIYPQGYLVSFCNYVKGMLYKKTLDEVSNSTPSFFYEGQILKFRIASVDQSGQINLELAEFKCQAGTILQGRITTIQPSGLHVAFPNTKFNGFVPTMFLSTFPSLAQLIQDTYKPNEPIDAVCITQNVYSVKDARSIQKTPIKQWIEVNLGDIVPAFVKNVAGDIIDLLCLIEKHTKIVKIHAKMLLEDYNQTTNINLIAEQLLYVRILGKNNTMGTLTCSAKLSDVWHGDLMETAMIFSQYLRDMKRIQNCTKSEILFTDLKPGTITNGRVVNIDAEKNEALVELSENVQGIIKSSNLSKNQLAIGQNVEVLVIWIDYTHKFVYLTMKKKYVTRKKKPDVTIKSLSNNTNGIKCDVLLISDDLIVTYPRKVTDKFIYVPTRFHYNDLQPCISTGIREGDIVIVRIMHEAENQFIGMFEHIYQAFVAMKNDINRKRKAESEREENAKRMCLENTENAENLFITDTEGSTQKIPKHCNFHRSKSSLATTAKNSIEITAAVALENNSCVPQLDGTYESSENDTADDEELDDKNSKSKKVRKINRPQNNMTIHEKKRKLDNPDRHTILPGIQNFWTANLNRSNKMREIKDEPDDTVGSSSALQTKKIRTPQERFKAARDEEARISEIEQNRIKGESQPSTSDDFERLLLAFPNNSATWINYMVFHLQTNDIDGARQIARKALKKISYREEQELFNIWIALLNLELRFNDMDAFETVLKESTLVNDPFKIYSKCLQMLADVKKVQELSNMIVTYTKKFRSNPDCWYNAATAYFEVGLMEKAKQLLQRALASLPEREHINTIIRFANLNNKYDNKNTAHALLEQVITSYPKRVDCWSQYVDMLVKDKEIDLARQILDRAVSQKIPMKKMRTLFKKYLDFEEKYGDANKVKNVKAMASSYVEREIKL